MSDGLNPLAPLREFTAEGWQCAVFQQVSGPLGCYADRVEDGSLVHRHWLLPVGFSVDDAEVFLRQQLAIGIAIGIEPS